MNGKEFLAADNITGTQPRNDAEQVVAEQRRADARVTISVYTRRQDLPETQRLNLYRQLVDELGLNGRAMQTSRHYQKNNPKWVGEL